MIKRIPKKIVYLTQDQVDMLVMRLMRFKIYKWSIGKV